MPCYGLWGKLFSTLRLVPSCTLPPLVYSAHGPRVRLFPSPTSWPVPRTWKGQRDVARLWTCPPRNADPSQWLCPQADTNWHPEDGCRQEAAAGRIGTRSTQSHVNAGWNLCDKTSTALRKKHTELLSSTNSTQYISRPSSHHSTPPLLKCK